MLQAIGTMQFVQMLKLLPAPSINLAFYILYSLISKVLIALPVMSPITTIQSFDLLSGGVVTLTSLINVPLFLVSSKSISIDY